MDAAFSSIATGVVIYSPDGHLVRMNPAAQDLLLYGEEDWGRPIEKRLALLGPRTSEGKPFASGESPPERALRGETVRNIPMIVQRRDGRTLWLNSSGAPITTPDGRVLDAVVSIFDMTPLHELQEAREAYIHTASHDLRNPLSLIQGHARLLARELEQRQVDSKLSARVDTMLRAASQMNTLIQDLVDAARQEGGQLRLDLRPVDLRDFVASLLGRSAPTLEVSRIRIRVPGLPAVNADPGRLERILINLLSNALKYSPESCPVDLEAELERGFVRVSVRDRGRGIAPEEIPHVFDRYFRGKATAKAEGASGSASTRRACSWRLTAGASGSRARWAGVQGSSSCCRSRPTAPRPPRHRLRDRRAARERPDSPGFAPA
jgi:PAS domain S-box-containing protein